MSIDQKMTNKLAQSRDGRVHVSTDKITSLIDRSDDDRHNFLSHDNCTIFFKPGGLWYSYRQNFDDPHDCLRTDGVFYDVQIDADFVSDSLSPFPNSILQLHCSSEIRKFCQKYRQTNLPLRDFFDWKLVKKDFAGVDFEIYNKFDDQFLRYLTWYNTVDFPSGCVWRVDKVKIVEIFDN